MLLSEMEQKSPVRILEKSTHGGVGKGNLGVFLSRPGVGKTACLVYIALDEIIRGNKVIHFGVEKTVEKVNVWYNEMSKNLVESFQLSNASELREKIEKNLIIMSYLNNSFCSEKMKSGLENAVQQGKFNPQVVIIDGFDFEKPGLVEEVVTFKRIAEEFGVEMWFSGKIHRENMRVNERNIPCPYDQFEDQLSVIVLLDPVQEAIFLRLLKDHDNPVANLHIKLDPKSLLVKPRYT